MEGVDFSKWPEWVLAILVFVTIFKAPISKGLSKAFPTVFGILTQASAEKVAAAEHARMQEIRAAEYERMRESFHKDKTFELLEDTVKLLREDRKASREDVRDQLKQNQEMFKGINRLTSSVNQLSDIVRILSQNSAKADDRWGEIAQSVARTDDRVSRIEKQITDKAVKE